MSNTGPGEVPNGPLREAVLGEINSGSETWTSLCRRIGWVRPGGKGDVTRMQRCLGTAQASSKGYTYTTTHITRETALTICRALDADPVDFGL